MFRTALTQLAALSVMGITFNFDVDAVPETLHRGQLPALLVLPIDPQIDGLRFTDRGAGFEALAFANSARTISYRVNHLMLIAPLPLGAGMRSHLPRLIDLIDAYFTALSDHITLDGALLEPAKVQVEPGIYRYGGVDYVGCAFRHTWLISG